MDDETPHRHRDSTPDVQGVPRFIGGVFGFVFLGIGVTVIGFLWGAPFGEFGSPPLFFRIFGSFIALAFVAMGGGTAWAAITGVPLNTPGRSTTAASTRQPSAGSGERNAVGYECESCGAPLSSDADVSPHGDVKCPHCDRWFNIHS